MISWVGHAIWYYWMSDHRGNKNWLRNNGLRQNFEKNWHLQSGKLNMDYGAKEEIDKVGLSFFGWKRRATTCENDHLIWFSSIHGWFPQGLKLCYNAPNWSFDWFMSQTLKPITYLLLITYQKCRIDAENIMYENWVARILWEIMTVVLKQAVELTYMRDGKHNS